MNLLSMTSQAEYDAVIGLLRNLKTLNATYFDTTHISIDGQFVGDPYSAAFQTSWFSYITNTKLPFTLNWASGEPNSPDREYCLSIRTDFVLNNCECGPQTVSSPMRFICKRNDMPL
jgi:hypothetical protein